MELKDLLNWVGAAAFVLIFLVFAIFWVGFHRGEQGQFQQGVGNGGVGGNCSILFPGGAGTDAQIGAAIDQWIIKNGPDSPLIGTGAVFAASGRANDVNPALMVAIARKESSLGVKIPDDTYNPFGRTATESQPGVQIGTHKWYKFNSWQEAIQEEGSYLQRVYISQGINTLGKMVEKYCPPSECDVNTYVKQIADWINEVTALANGALGIGCTSAPGGCGLEVVDLTNISLISGTPKLMKGAAEEFNNLAKEFYQKSGSRLPITSMYRSHDQQASECGTVSPDGKTCSNPNANPPGMSMHEAGLAFDTQLKKNTSPNGLTADQWNLLRTIGATYHFQVSDTSGGQYGAKESWHFDYTGFKDKFWYGQPKITNAIDAANNCMGQ
jgi:hypothetical protein